MEVKTFDVTLAGEVVKVPCQPNLGMALDIFAAMDESEKLTGRAGSLRALLLHVAAGTGKPEGWLKTNLSVDELRGAAAALKQGWVASGFFKQTPVEAAPTGEPTPMDTGR